MSILVNKNSKVVVQGITGAEGTFHTNQMIEYGTKVVAGVTPGKGGIKATDHDVPVYNSVEESVEKAKANTSIIFVPPPFAAEAIIESSYAGIELIVCITEGVPVRDMVKVKQIIKQNHRCDNVLNLWDFAIYCGLSLGQVKSALLFSYMPA